MKIFAYALYVFLALLVGVGLGLFMAARENLPEVDLLENYKPSTITRIYDANNELIAEFYHQRRAIVPLSRVPEHLIKAILVAEDANFFRHRGVDFRGIARAAWKNLRARRIKEGGSTITQQLSKQLFLTPERSLMRKIKEVILSLKIERNYTKDEILHLYLNQVYFGSGAYGVGAAAEVYFGKDVSELDLAQAALIAGLVRAPTTYSPFLNPERALRRRGHILQRMMEEGYIAEKQARQIGSQPIKLVEGRGERLNRAPYFIEYIRLYLEQKYGKEDVYNNGLEVYTTLDLKMQTAAERALAEGLIEVSKRRGFRLPTQQVPDGKPFRKEQLSPPKIGDILAGEVELVGQDGLLVRIGNRLGKVSDQNMKWAGLKNPSAAFRGGERVLVKVLSTGDGSGDSIYSLALEQEPEIEGALVAVDPRNGYIRAMAGGYDYYRSPFNRATQARRHPGSAFKPVIYTAAIDLGYRPSDIVIDSPIAYRDPWTGKVWKPANFERKFYGPITLRHALEHSRNLATVNLAMKLTPETVIEYARRMGLTTPIEPYPSIALGAFGVSLVELSSVYGVLANNGVRAEPMAIRYIADRDGKILEENYPKLKDALSPETSYIVTSMLQGVVQRGTGWRVKPIGIPVAGKTGTSDKYTDAWFIGYTPNLVSGVWVGLDDNTAIGDYETGNRAASPIWLEFMKKAIKGIPQEDFIKPDGISVAKIDAYSGLLPTDKCSDQVIEEVFVKGTEPTEFCPDESNITAGTGSWEKSVYQR